MSGTISVGVAGTGATLPLTSSSLAGVAEPVIVEERRSLMTGTVSFEDDASYSRVSWRSAEQVTVFLPVNLRLLPSVFLGTSPMPLSTAIGLV